MLYYRKINYRTCSILSVFLDLHKVGPGADPQLIYKPCFYCTPNLFKFVAYMQNFEKMHACEAAGGTKLG